MGKCRRVPVVLACGSRPLADLLPGATRAKVRDAADYLKMSGLAWVRS
jgi:hypothetical protein